MITLLCRISSWLVWHSIMGALTANTVLFGKGSTVELLRDIKGTLEGKGRN